MNTATFNNFYREINQDSGRIASLSESVITGLNFVISLVLEIYILYLIKLLIKKLDYCEKQKITNDNDLTKLDGMKEDLSKLLTILEKVRFLPLLKSFAEKIIEEFENKIENLYLATNLEIRNLVSSIDAKSRQRV